MERRFDRIEERVDQIKDDVGELKVTTSVQTALIQEMKEDMKTHTQLVRDHVTGDDKIITHIEPLLSALPDLNNMINDFNYKQENKKRKFGKMKELSLKLGLLTGFFGILFGLLKLL